MSNALEMIVRANVEAAVAEITARANEAFQVIAQENPGTPTVHLEVPTIELPKAAPIPVQQDALNRAGRSFLGGAIVTVLGTVGTEVAKVMSSGSFDPLDGTAWKTAGIGLIGALGYAGVAYVQRFLFTPKVDK